MSELLPGKRVAGRYALDRLLGEGGMGAVWAVTHTVTQRRYAMKFLKASANHKKEMRKRFIREARAASVVDHPNIVHIHDVFELEDETPVMVMDLLEGETLGRKLERDAPLELGETASLLLPAVSAVGAAHARGIVHRDLKPDNIFLVRAADSGPPSIRVLDFGIAKVLGPESAAHETGLVTGTGAMLGTPCYMSPEQGFGERDIDHRTDVWAFGVILYEALSGARPVEGDNLGQLLKRLMTDGITPIQAIVPDLPADVADLIGRMLSRERDERPESLHEVFEVLGRYADATAPAFGAPSVHPSVDEDDRVSERQVVSGTDTADAHSDTEASPAVASGQDTAGPTSISVARPGSGRRMLFVGGGAVAAAGVVAALALGGGAESAGSEAAASSMAELPGAAVELTDDADEEPVTDTRDEGDEAQVVRNDAGSAAVDDESTVAQDDALEQIKEAREPVVKPRRETPRGTATSTPARRSARTKPKASAPAPKPKRGKAPAPEPAREAAKEATPKRAAPPVERRGGLVNDPPF